MGKEFREYVASQLVPQTYKCFECKRETEDSRPMVNIICGSKGGRYVGSYSKCDYCKEYKITTSMSTSIVGEDLDRVGMKVE